MKNIGVIGLGVMATRMISNVRRYGGFRVLAGWDPCSIARHCAVKTNPDLIIMESPEAIIKDPKIDGIYIASPPETHADYAMVAIELGKPVLSEKPLDVDLAKSRKLVDCAAESGTGNAVNFTFATAPAVEEIMKLLKDGSIGDVASVDILLHFCKWPRDWQASAKWLCDRNQGGFLRETFSHYAYLIEKLFGPAELIKAVTQYPEDKYAAETHVLALMNCGGIPVTFSGGTGGLNASGADRVEFTVWGSKAVCCIYDWNRLRSNEGKGWVEHLSHIHDTRQVGYERQIGAIRAFFAEEDNPLPDFHAALRVQSLVEEILVERL